MDTALRRAHAVDARQNEAAVIAPGLSRSGRMLHRANRQSYPRHTENIKSLF